MPQEQLNSNPISAINAVILCGGLGKRLVNEIGSRPKGLALIRGRPILDLIVDYLVAQGVRGIVLAVGHRSDQIVTHFSDRRDVEIVFSVETIPLGTGGAVLHALNLVRSDPFFVVNGDSYCSAPLEEVYQRHLEAEAEATIVLAKTGDRGDAGNVIVDDTGRIIEFAEKRSGTAVGKPFMNAGVYLLSKSVFKGEKEGKSFSLEFDVFPSLVASRRCWGVVVDSDVVDIGTPARLRAAQDLLK